MELFSADARHCINKQTCSDKIFTLDDIWNINDLQNCVEWISSNHFDKVLPDNIKIFLK